MEVLTMTYNPVIDVATVDLAELNISLGAVSVEVEVNNTVKAIADAKYEGNVEALIKDIAEDVVNDIAESVEAEIINRIDNLKWF